MKEYSLYRKLNIFFENISVMISSGQSMVAVVNSVANDFDGEWKTALMAMSEEINSGASLSESMENQNIFPEYAKKLIKASEQSGRIEETSEALASFYNKREHMRSLAESALIQPLTLLAILAVVLAAFMAFVLPIIGNVYTSLGGSSNAYIVIGYAIGIAAFAAVAVILGILFSVKSKLKTSSLEDIPLFKRKGFRNIVSSTELAFFMCDFSTRVSGGILFDNAFAEAAKAVADDEIKEKLCESAKKISQGETFISALLDVNVLPKTYVHMINSGMRNGRIDEALDEVTDLLFKEAEFSVETLVMKIEPMLTGFFTIAISASLFSVMLPLIGVITAIG